MTLPSTTATPSAWQLARSPRMWPVIDFLALLLLSALVALAFWPVYGSPLLFITVLGFAALGMVIALISTLRHLRVGTTALLAVGGWLVFGSALVMPSASIGFVVPTGRTLFGLLTGPVTAWRDMLTLDPPIGETYNLLAAPGIVGYLVGLVGLSISLRSTHPSMAWLPPALGYVVGALLGSRVAVMPLWVGLGFFATVLIWTTYRRGTMRDRLSETQGGFRPVRLVLGVAVLAVAGLVGMLAAPALAGSAERSTLRSAVEIPVNLAEQRSPLQAFRANITKHRSETLFEVAGARPGDIVRLATLDSYDGIAFRVATLDDKAVDQTTFRRVGQWIDDDTPGDPLTLHVRIHNYSDVWVPTVGRSTAVHFDGERAIKLGESFFYNHASGTGVTLQHLHEGDTYELSAVVPQRPSEAQIADAGAGSVKQPKAQRVPETLRTLSRQWTEGAPTAGAQALAIEKQLQLGYFSHGQEDEVPSQPGHSQSRLLALLDDPKRMIGDGEQYATTMALMARELGIPSRVIYGFEVEGSSQITGEQVGAWAELNLEGLGWVRFNPTPPKDRKADDEIPEEPPKPRPYVVNPPPPPQKPDVPPDEEQLPTDPGEIPEEQQSIDWRRVGTIALIAGIPLLTIVVPIALIIGLKLRRRARRKNDPDVANRVAGAWLELVDKARDLGRSPSLSATRSEQAVQLTEDFTKIEGTADPVSLAKEADWLVFAPGSPSEDVAAGYWAESKSVSRGMRRSVAWPKWLLSRLSTKSFRKMK
ncbi:MAG: transglutaminaseTgpA domain-containing protein [Propionibacteriaceae bacterium]|nr:transglutaminaseTgpA domain-containing protein [Propionibacteriaceae bacterium]